METLDQLQWDLLRKQVSGVRQTASPAPSRKARASLRWRALILMAIGLFFIWEVMTRSMAAYWSETSPEFAVAIPATNPTALVSVAQAELKALKSTLQKRDVEPTASRGENLDAKPEIESSEPEVVSAESYVEPRSRLESALRKDPLNARAFTLLGQIAAASSAEGQTERFMGAAARRSLHESNAVYWLMRKSYEEGDASATIRHADAVLRKRPDAMLQVIPLLGKIAEAENSQSELVELLATNPPYRVKFFIHLHRYIKDARTPLNILLKLKNSPYPPSHAELRSYLTFLLSKGFHEVAYYTWLQFMPAEQLAKLGLLFNGNFESPLSGLPFDWTFGKNPGVTAKVTRRPDKEGGHALFLDFGGLNRVSSLSVAQVVMLAPGRYRFDGKYRSDLRSPRGLVWHIECLGDEKMAIAKSEPVSRGSGEGWQDFSFSFAIAEGGCPVQKVRLAFDARWASERFISGSVWYDDLRIEGESLITQ